MCIFMYVVHRMVYFISWKVISARKFSSDMRIKYLTDKMLFYVKSYYVNSCELL